MGLPHMLCTHVFKVAKPSPLLAWNACRRQSTLGVRTTSGRHERFVQKQPPNSINGQWRCHIRCHHAALPLQKTNCHSAGSLRNHILRTSSLEIHVCHKSQTFNDLCTDRVFQFLMSFTSGMKSSLCISPEPRHESSVLRLSTRQGRSSTSTNKYAPSRVETRTHATRPPRFPPFRAPLCQKKADRDAPRARTCAKQAIEALSE